MSESLKNRGSTISNDKLAGSFREAYFTDLFFYGTVEQYKVSCYKLLLISLKSLNQDLI